MEEVRVLRGLSYSSVNVMRSALSVVIRPVNGLTFGEQPDTIQYMKGVFQITPKVPRYSEVWDLNDVLEFLLALSPASKLSLQLLTLKTATLLLIVTGQRVQTLKLLCLKTCVKSHSSFTFYVTDNVKQSRVGDPALVVKVKSYVPDRRLCIVHYLTEYIKRTRPLRQSSSLFVSYRRPHQEVKKGTIAKWIKTILAKAGVNTAIFQAHSVRAASCSKAVQNGVPLSSVLKQGGWRRESTFQAYYNKPVNKQEKSFQKVVLNS